MISILTPSYNYGRYISDCLDSVELQGVGAQHVVMDAGSPDDTLNVLKARHNLTWRSEADHGQSDALNKALSLAGGDIVGWLNADEYYLPGALAAVERLFEDEPTTDVVYGDSIEVGPQGEFLRLQRRYPRIGVALRYGCVLSSCATFVRRSALPEAPWDTSLNYIMDWDLWWRMYRRNPRGFTYLPRVLGAFRVHDERVTAEPLRFDSEQHRRVRMRYSLREAGFGLRIDRLAGRADHVAQRLTTGAYLREAIASRRFAAMGTRWFIAQDELTNATQITELVSK